jgi:hypothetical protein
MIDSDNIRNNSIQQTDLGRDSVGKSELKADSVGPRYLTDGLLAQIAKGGKDGADGTPGKSAFEIAQENGDTSATETEWLQSLHGAEGKPGERGKPGLAEVQTDGPYSSTWSGDGGANLQTAIVDCPEGKAAIGGGFSTWGGAQDLGGANKNIQITVSAPYTKNYVPVNEQGSFVADQWIVKGYNNGTTEQIVRPWVVCAKVG